MAYPNECGIEALQRLNAVDPPSWLAPNPELSETARAASKYLFSTLRPFSQKSPLDQLLVDGFDAEQIWQQIDLQSQPLLSTLRRRVKQLAKNPEEIAQLKVALEGGNNTEANKKKQDEWDEEESDGFDEELDEVDEDEDDEDDEEGVEKEKGKEEGMEDEDEEGEESGESESDEENDEGGGGIEDKFLKIDELAKYLEKEEENMENGEADMKGEEEDDDEESDEAGGFGIGDDEDGEVEDMENARCLFLSSRN